MTRLLSGVALLVVLGVAVPTAPAQEDDPRLAQWESLREQAQDAFHEGDYATAERLFRQMLGDCASLGERSGWCVGFAKHWLAYTLDRAGRNEEAVEILRDLASSLRRAPEPNPHQLSRICAAIATISQEIGRYQDAIDAWNEACALWSEEHGDDDFDLASLYMSLANAQHEAGRLDDAATTIGRAMTIYREHYNEDDAELSGVYQFSGRIAWERDRYDEAIDCFDRLYRMSLAANGRGSSSTLSALEWRGHSLTNAGRLEDALRDAEELCAVYGERYGETHPEMFRHSLGAARLAITLGHWDHAADWLARVERIVEGNDGFDNFDRRDMLFERWRFHERRGEAEQAAATLERLRAVLN